MNPVYINATSSYFPNAPVDNDNIERILGTFRGKPSKSRAIVLGSNQIKTRHYAIDPVTRKMSHTNAQITASAIEGLFQNTNVKMSDMQLLACGSSTPDVLMPAHGQMVQGLLKNFSGEVVTTSGVCCSSMGALKMAFLSVLSGDSTGAIVAGSETASKYMRGEFLESECEDKVEELKKNPFVAFEQDFLRWMLSDGAGAVRLSDKPEDGKVNLKINWIEGRSYSNEQPACMYGGGHREDNGEMIPWAQLRLEGDAKKLRFAMNAKQDIRLLRDKIPGYTVVRPLPEIKKKRGLRPGDYQWFLPHYSSHFFRETLFNTLTEVDFQIPFDRWFTSLYEKGNIGSASMFVFIDDLVKSGKLNRGEKILCYIPESARFSVYYLELEVV